jgi:Uma2 family endonuclease
MGTPKTGISIEEYLRTSFPDGDREYVDGEVVSKAMPPWIHGRLQARLVEIFYDFKRAGVEFHTAVEVRSQTTEARVRLPDFSAYLIPPEGEVLSAPPFAVAEILSPDDRHSQLMEKLREYRDWGVAHIWVIDPGNLTLSEFVSQGLVDVAAFDLPEFGLNIQRADLFPPRQ